VEFTQDLELATSRFHYKIVITCNLFVHLIIQPQILHRLVKQFQSALLKAAVG
jgi:hypothetical protein